MPGVRSLPTAWTEGSGPEGRREKSDTVRSIQCTSAINCMATSPLHYLYSLVPIASLPKCFNISACIIIEKLSDRPGEKAIHYPHLEFSSYDIVTL